MATLVFGTIGRAVGGPIGGILGTFLGGFADRAIFGGGGKAREGARAGNLSVQASTYGDPIPRLHGSMRVAGNLIWTSGIVEHASTAGGGKHGTKTTSYSYTASFAVALSARAVLRTRRIWADGKLMRDAGGAAVLPAVIRLHDGSEGQPADPLLIAAEGAAPAYRGLAYVVFEDLALAEFGNRIPNLTFEVVADEALDGGRVVGDLCDAGGLRGVGVAGAFPALGGHVAARAGDVRAQLGGLVELLDLTLADDGERLTLRAGPAAAGVDPAAGDYGSTAAGGDPHRARVEGLAPSSAAADALALGFYDIMRDYQPGLQRAVRRTPARTVLQLDAPLALDAVAAKHLAASVLARAAAARTTATVNLPPRALAVRAGTTILRPGDTVPWRVRRWTMSGFAVELELVRQGVGSLASGPADSGRVHESVAVAAGTTVLEVLDLPPLPGALATVPRLWLAAAGASPGWRRAPVAISLDDGGSYTAAGMIAAPSIIGTLATGLASGGVSLWDRNGVCDVTLLGSAMWLEGRDEAAVLGGANLALIGDELVQFAEVMALAPGVFRLATLLRGRRGSPVAVHPVGTRFVLLDADRLLPVDLDVEQVGRTLRLRAEGAGDVGAAAQALVLAGTALRPLAPVFVRGHVDGGDLVFGWVRCSRAGFGWLDGVDAPLAEETEAYALTLSSAGGVVRRATATVAGWRYTAAMRSADGLASGTAVTLSVAQTGALPGTVTTAQFILS